MAIARGHNVLNFDALTYAGRRENHVDLEGTEEYIFVYGDICNERLVEKHLAEGFEGKPFDCIVNFAAESHVDRSLYLATKFARSNCEGVATLIEAARKTGIPTFVQISTDEVYGSLGADGKFTLDSPLRPSSPYSSSKTAGDLMALSFFHTWGYDVRITRCTNNYGPYQFPEKFIPTILTRALEGKEIPIYGDGMNVRDWIYVDDHCEGIFSVIEKGKAGGTYLFGGSKELANIELCKGILKTLSDIAGENEDKLQSLMKFVTDRPGHDRRYAIDWSLSEKELGWIPRTPFPEGIKRTVRWYLENRDWWSEILKENKS
jgi:dTDP-glucose 4,6-dehydratase